jgi:glycosyltransferase involved in cell wall biosynthesis
VVQRIAAEWQPDVIQLEHDALAYLAPMLTEAGRARLLVCHDPGLRAAEHMAAVTRGRQRTAHRLDQNVWKRYWRATFSALDAVVVFTDEDKVTVRDVVPDLLVETIPLGIDLPDQPLSAIGTDESVIFVGGYAHQPNADAAVRLMTTIMPRVRVRSPGLKLVLVGDRPTDEMLRAAGPDDEITGRVESVEPFVGAAAVVALPIRLGGGMRVKLLESLASGKAVVASPLAAAGLPLTDGEQVLLATSDEEFSTAIQALLADPGLRERLGSAARRWALDNLGWDSRVRDYERLYRGLLGGGVVDLPIPELSSPRPSIQPAD